MSKTSRRGLKNFDYDTPINTYVRKMARDGSRWHRMLSERDYREETKHKDARRGKNDWSNE